jgi:hypothetical protein
MKRWVRRLVLLDACKRAVRWAQQYDSLPDAWDVCKRGDWMLWLAARMCRSEETHRLIAFASCAAARTALQYVSARELRPLRAIETTKAWTVGKATLDDVHAANSAAFAAFDTYSPTAYAAAAAAFASELSSASVIAAANAAAFAADSHPTAYRRALRESADLVRRMLPCPVIGANATSSRRRRRPEQDGG